MHSPSRSPLIAAQQRAEDPLQVGGVRFTLVVSHSSSYSVTVTRRPAGIRIRTSAARASASVA
jgi:hypothetical protein